MIVTSILSFGNVMCVAFVVVCVLFFKHVHFPGKQTTVPLAFFSILFTAGLDGGLILLPLSEFSTYDNSPYYWPLTTEFIYWGITVWFMYFVSCCYFCCIEPKAKIFNIPLVKRLNGCFILLTAAFTVGLSVDNLPRYLSYLNIDSVSSTQSIMIAATTIIVATIMSTSVSLITRLSHVSILCFMFLLFATSIYVKSDWQTLMTGLQAMKSYFGHFHHTIIPKNAYHTFYLGWWFSWSIMLGQYLAQFTRGMKLSKVLFCVCFAPILPLFIWFTVLFEIQLQQLTLAPWLSLCFVVVAFMFVINSVDFMIHLYSDSLSIQLKKYGNAAYVLINSILLIATFLLFKEHILLIEYVGSANILLALLVSLILLFRVLKGNQLRRQENP